MDFNFYQNYRQGYTVIPITTVRGPNSIFTDDIVGAGADNDSPNIVQKMVSNQVVWHTTYRNYIDSHKVQRARKRSGPEVAI